MMLMLFLREEDEIFRKACALMAFEIVRVSGSRRNGKMQKRSHSCRFVCVLTILYGTELEYVLLLQGMCGQSSVQDLAGLILRTSLPRW